MRTLALLSLAACGPAVETDPAEANGTVLYAQDTVLVVQHDDPLGRITVGIARYQTAAALDLEPGQQVDLWLSGDARPLTVDRAEVTGTGPLPAQFKPGGYAVTGTVVRVDGGKLTLDHEPIEGLMDAMVMPFDAGPDVAPAFKTGDQVRARLIVSSHGYRLVEVEKTGEATVELRTDVKSLALGETLPAVVVPVSQGGEWTIGAGQPKPTAISFIYTRCPDPNFCPAIVSRMAALQERIGDKARILLVTIDPDYDHLPVLGMYGGLAGAKPDTWSLGRLDPIDLNQLALQAGLSVTVRAGRISHKLRLLILDADGVLIERYDDNEWPLDRVAGQLLTGEPSDATELGSLYGEPE